jgi:sugar O-acyltransferase (sialic acid O-acetyltransferase NeuD family)
MKPIAILGTGGNCVDILDTISDINAERSACIYQCIGFLDDDPATWGKEIHGVKVLGPLDYASQLKNAFFVNGIGSPQNFWLKEVIIAKTQLGPERFETIVHPSASVSRMSELGRGTVIFQNVTVTSNVRIGQHVIILPNTVISHDDVIGDYTCIAGGVCISGQVNIGRLCYLGTNSAIRGNLEIGDCCLVGMGSVVVSDIQENSVVYGVPARFIRKTRDPVRG